MAALAGIIHCQIEDGHIGEAEQQLEFLTEVRAVKTCTSLSVYLYNLCPRENGQI